MFASPPPTVHLLSRPCSAYTLTFALGYLYHQCNFATAGPVLALRYNNLQNRSTDMAQPLERSLVPRLSSMGTRLVIAGYAFALSL